MGPAAVADFLDSPYNRVADVKMLYFFERLSPFALEVLVGLAVLSVVVPYCLRTIDSPAYAHVQGRVAPRAEWEAAEAAP